MKSLQRTRIQIGSERQFFFFFFFLFFEKLLVSRTFELSVSFAPAQGEETRLQSLKESVNALRNNVIELRAKKMFLANIKNVTNLEQVLPSEKQISKIGDQF